MPEKILVALEKNDSAEEILPYVRQIARPGMKVVFLIADRVDGFEYLLRQKATMETGLHAALALKRTVEQHIGQRGRDSARQKILAASEELRRQGVEVTTDFYTVTLASALKSYSSVGDAFLTMIPARCHALADILRLLFRFATPAPSSVILLRPAMIGGSK